MEALDDGPEKNKAGYEQANKKVKRIVYYLMHVVFQI